MTATQPMKKSVFRAKQKLAQLIVNIRDVIANLQIQAI